LSGLVIVTSRPPTSRDSFFRPAMQRTIRPARVRDDGGRGTEGSRPHEGPAVPRRGGRTNVSWTGSRDQGIPARPDIAPRPDTASPAGPWWAAGSPVEAPPDRRGHGRSILAAVLAVLVLIGSGIGIGWTLGVGNRSEGPRVVQPEPPLTTASPPVEGKQLSVAAVAARVTPAIVDVNTVIGAFAGRRPLAQAAGTGMILTSTGEVLTNNHVISGATSIRVTVQHRGQFQAMVIGADPVDDVALLQLSNASNLPTVSLGDPSTAAVGDEVVAVGN